MKKLTIRPVIALLACVCAFEMTGCGIYETRDLTQEQTDLISEYAAGLLARYNKTPMMGLRRVGDIYFPDETSVLPTPEPEEEMIEEIADVTSEESSDVLNTEGTEQDGAAEDALAEGMTGEEGELSSDALSGGETAGSSVPIAQALGLEGFEVAYTGYETCMVYPPEESDDLVFSMQAAPGMELLILHFNLTNVTESEQTCNMIGKDVKLRVILNGGERVRAQSTILLNDLSQYSGTLEPFAMDDAIAVFEVAEGTGETLSKLKFVVVSGGQEEVYPVL